MRLLIVLAAVLQVVFGGVSISMPYLNPAGVTYVSGYQGHGAPLTYGADVQYTAPLQYAAAAAIPANVEAHHVGYARAQVPAVAAVPFVKHVPTVSQVPVTRYEAHPAVIEKQLDVIKPAVSTRKFEVRRPGLQKQFYDIEERVIVRPAGSALVELDEPTSKVQKGPTVVQPLHAGEVPLAHHSYAHASAEAQTAYAPSTIPVVAHAPVHLTIAPVLSHAPIQGAPAPIIIPSSTPSPSKPAPAAPSPASSSNEEESVVVENEDFRNAQFRYSQPYSTPLNAVQQQDLQIRQALQRDQQAFTSQIATAQSQFQQAQIRDALAFRQHQAQQQQQFDTLLQSARSVQENNKVPAEPQVIARSNGAPQEETSGFAPESSTVVPSVRTSPEESISNQNKLIELLTARGGVTEVELNRAAETKNAGNVRARVLSVTPAPEDAEPTGERVSTRRVVVSRPVETLQEVDVVEPATKYERVSIQQPTLIKTAHLDHVQVHGSVPVLGKALAPAVAEAAVPVFQKTISPAYQYYH